MLKEWLLIPGLPRISILSMLIICILICGCITNSATDNTNMTVTPNASTNASIPAVVSPVPLNASDQSTLPPKPVVNTSTATPKANNSTKVNNDIAPGLPPAIIFTHVPAYGSNETLTGMVTGIDNPVNYKLAIYVKSYGWYNVPSGDDRLTDIKGDGTWECNISGIGAGKRATEIGAFLVRAGFMPSKVMGRYGLPTDIRDNATAVNSVTRTVPAPTPKPTESPIVITGPSIIY